MALTSNQRNTAVLAGSAGLTALVSAAWFAIEGLHEESIDLTNAANHFTVRDFRRLHAVTAAIPRTRPG